MTFTKLNIIFILIPALIISLLFVTPFMVSDEIYNGVVMAKEFWFFGVVALMLFYTALQLLIKKEKRRIEFNLIDIFLLAFYTWCFIRAIFTPYTPFYHNHKLQILTGMIVVYFFVKNAIRNENNERNEENENNRDPKHSFIYSFFHSFINKPSFILSFLIFSFILSGFLQAIYGLLQLYGIYSSHHNLFKITGSFINPAPYAMYLAVVFPVALGKTLFNENIKENERNEGSNGENKSFILSFLHFLIRFLPLATVIAILLILPATMNRASWLGAAVGGLVVLQYKYNWWGKIKLWLNSRTKKLLALTGSIIVVGGICVSLFYLKAGSSNGRLFIWEVTLGKIAEKPLFGHGLGRFEAEYNNWQAEYFMKHPEDMGGPKGWVAGNTKYAFNEFLEFMSETGILGLLLFLTIITLSLATKESKNEVYLFSPALASFLLFLTISSPLFSLPNFLLFIFILSIFSSFKKNINLSYFTFRQSWVFRGINFLIFIIVISIFSIFCVRSYKSYLAWNIAFKLYHWGNYQESKENYEKAYILLKHNNLFLAQYGKLLSMMNLYNESLIILKDLKQKYSDQYIYQTIGDDYKGLYLYKEAEQSYLFASFMIPTSFYPKYCLFELYNKTGNTLNAKKWGEIILNMPVKVDSPAIKEIKQLILTN